MAWIRKYAMSGEVPEMKQFIGRACRITDDKGNKRVIEVEEILGSLKYPTKFQVNCRGASYFISMLDFFAQMNGEYVSDADLAAFDDSVFFVHEQKNKQPFLHSPRTKGKLWKK
jgi:hypothetical protein